MDIKVKKILVTPERAKQWMETAVRRHKHLPPELKTKVAVIREAFRVAMPKSQKEWEDGFCFDLNPEHEVQLWLQMACGYDLYFERHEQTKEEGIKVLSVLLSRSSTDDLLEIYAYHKDAGFSMEFVSEVCACYEMLREALDAKRRSN